MERKLKGNAVNAAQITLFTRKVVLFAKTADLQNAADKLKGDPYAGIIINQRVLFGAPFLFI